MRVANRLWCASRHVVSVISTPLCSRMACRAARQQCQAVYRSWHESRSCQQTRRVHGCLAQTLPASTHLCKPSWTLFLQHIPPAGWRRRVWHSQASWHDVAGRRPHRARVIRPIDHLWVDGWCSSVQHSHAASQASVLTGRRCRSSDATAFRVVCMLLQCTRLNTHQLSQVAEQLGGVRHGAARQVTDELRIALDERCGCCAG